MSYSESIVRTFFHLRKSADSAFAAVGAEGFPAARKYLVCIGLVSHVEDEFVGRGVIDIVQADYEFNSTEARCDVTRIAGAAVEHIATEFRAELRQDFLRKFAKVLRTVYFVEIA